MLTRLAVVFILQYSPPLISTGDWFQDPLQIPKSTDAQAHSRSSISVVPHLQIQPTSDCIIPKYLLKTSSCKWTHTVQSRVVQRSTVCTNTKSLCCTPETNIMLCQLYLNRKKLHEKGIILKKKH